MTYRKIVVSYASGIGDAIIATSVLKAIKEKYPTCHLAVIVNPHACEILRGIPFLDEVIAYPKKKSEIIAVIRRIWRFDLGICLDIRYRSPLVMWLARIPVRGGVGPKSKVFMTHATERYCEDDRRRYKSYWLVDNIKRSLGLSLEGDFEKLYIAQATTETKKKVTDLLQEVGMDDLPFIVISPFSNLRLKDWPITRYRELVDMIWKEYGVKTIIVGTKDMIPCLDGIGEINGVVNLVGKTTIEQMAEIIRRSQIVVAGCSSALHIAAAHKRPFIALYGPTLPVQYAPHTDGIILESSTACRPHTYLGGNCPNCKDKRCMQEILAEEVFDAFRTLWNKYKFK